MHTVITSINNAITLAQRLREISQNIEDAEFKNVLADLSLEMADTKLALAQVTEENAELKSELIKLKHSRGESPSDLTFKKFAYYSESDDGPFCSGCYDTKKQKIRLTPVTGHFASFGKFKCPSCDKRCG
jgi:regulator of replication initiation timing